MKTRLLTLTVITACTTVALPALAQTSAKTSVHSAAQTALPASPAPAQGSAAATPASRATPGTPKTLAAAANADARSRLPGTTTLSAAGSVIVLADGIVANAAIAPIQPPAAGFAYER